MEQANTWRVPAVARWRTLPLAHKLHWLLRLGVVGCFIGHGAYEEDHGGFLLWEDELGNPSALSDSRLADLLHPRGLRAVLLHGCQGTEA